MPINGLPAFRRITRSIAMPEPEEPTSYTASPPPQTHPQDDVEEA